ncbi:hypothetical protein [Niveispirillum fermenti]|uniref:hypothetical protein n=1 Tax=Niveispirillum fermenti TaxID=1233113 RepID=UPI003A8C62E9
MSASAEIFRFPGRGQDNGNPGGNSGAWSNQDLADIYRCIDQFARHGLIVEAASGMSDEREPWFAIEDVASGDALLHIARIDGFFVVHVLDGENWSGETLRHALSQINIGSLQALAGIDTTAGTGQDAPDAGDTDRDGSHAFLRIVSAVMAVLSADVIAGAISQDAVAAPPAMPEAREGDDAAGTGMDLLDLASPSDAPSVTHQDRHAVAAMDDDGVSPTLMTALTGPAVTKPEDHPAPAPDQEDRGTLAPIPMPAAIAVDAAEPAATAMAETPAITDDGNLIFTYGTERVQVAHGTDVSFTGIDGKEDLFLIILDRQDTDLTAKLGNFEEGKDSLVIEKAHDHGTSSAIVTDLGALVANGSANMTIIGQATVEIDLSTAAHLLVTGG